MGRRIVSFHFGSFTLEVDEYIEDEASYATTAELGQQGIDPADFITDHTTPMSVSVEPAETPLSKNGKDMLVREWTDRLHAYQTEVNEKASCTQCGARIICFASSGTMQISHVSTMSHPASSYDHAPVLSDYWKERYAGVLTAYGRLRELEAVPADSRAH